MTHDPGPGTATTLGSPHHQTSTTPGLVTLTMVLTTRRGGKGPETTTTGPTNLPTGPHPLSLEIPTTA
jgi:hypothetical protein